MKSAAAVPALALLAIAAPARADRRAFTHTYEYMTMPEAETEVEIYSQQSRAILGEASDQTFQLELEVEHGITSKWDFALYHVFTQTAGAAPESDVAFGLDEIKLETRYRLAERGEWPVNVVAYAEGVRKFGEPVWETEGKAIITRDFDKLTVALNLAAEVAFDAHADEPEIEAGWAGGLSYEIQPEIKVGAETWGGFELEESDVVKAWAGPVASWAPASNLWIATTVGFGLTDYADDLEVRGAIGMHLL